MKISRDGRPEARITEEQANRMEELAKLQSLRDYFLVALQHRRGLRVGSIVGCHERHRYYRRGRRGGPEGWVTYTVDLPGIKKEDVGSDGLAVHSKGGIVRMFKLPTSLLPELLSYAATLKPGSRIVPLTERQANNLVKKYARMAGVQEWDRLHNHRLRFRFGSTYARKVKHDWQLSDLLTHKDARSAKSYREELTPEEEGALLE